MRRRGRGCGEEVCDAASCRQRPVPRALLRRRVAVSVEVGGLGRRCAPRSRVVVVEFRPGRGRCAAFERRDHTPDAGSVASSDWGELALVRRQVFIIIVVIVVVVRGRDRLGARDTRRVRHGKHKRAIRVRVRWERLRPHSPHPRCRTTRTTTTTTLPLRSHLTHRRRTFPKVPLLHLHFHKPLGRARTARPVHARGYRERPGSGVCHAPAVPMPMGLPRTSPIGSVVGKGIRTRSH